MLSDVRAEDRDLYRWQFDALVSWLHCGRRGVVEAVTGSGKTDVAITAIADALRRDRQAGPGHRAQEPADSFARARQVGRAGYAGDVPVPQFDQVARRLVAALFLAGLDQVGIESGQRPLQRLPHRGVGAQPVHQQQRHALADLPDVHRGVAEGVQLPGGGHSSALSKPALDMPALGLDWNDRFTVYDEVTGDTFEWGQFNYVRLEPWRHVAHVLHVRR